MSKNFQLTWVIKLRDSLRIIIGMYEDLKSKNDH